jgi:hypothetical protein
MTPEAEEEVDGSIEESVSCFRAESRICGPDCVAWVTHPPEDKGRLSFTQRHCLDLSSRERTARHITIIAATLAEFFKMNKTAAADRQRKEAMGDAPKGGPFGDPFPLTPKVNP